MGFYYWKIEAHCELIGCEKESESGKLSVERESVECRV